MYKTRRLRLLENTEKMTMFLKCINNGRFMFRHNKRAKIGTVLMIIFYLLLALVLIYALNKAGLFTKLSWTNLKQKIFPFG